MRVITVVMNFSLFLPCAVQLAAAQEKEPIYDGRPVSEWIARLKDKDDKVRHKAAFSLRQLGPEAKAAVPALIDSLKDKNVSVREESAFALQQIGSPAKPAIPALIDALKDEDYWVRYWSLRALADFGGDARAAVPALAQILKGPDAELKVQAARGLWRMGENRKEVLAALIDVLQERWDVRAARMLGEIGPDAKPAVPALLKFSLGPRGPFSPGRCRDGLEFQMAIDLAVTDALRKIDPEAAKKVERERNDPKAAQTKAFEELTVAFRPGGVAIELPSTIRIGADGKCVYEVAGRPAIGKSPAWVPAKITHTLPPDRLRRLTGMLKDSEWLGKAAPKHADRLHANEYTLTLKRDGKAVIVLCKGDQEPYKALLILLRDLFKQEFLLYLMESVPERGPTTRQLLDSYVRAELGERSATKPIEELDYARYAGWATGLVRKPAGKPAEEVATAVRVVGLLRLESERKHLAELASDPDRRVREAATQALERLKGGK
jgi:hypothetical protein